LSAKVRSQERNSFNYVLRAKNYKLILRMFLNEMVAVLVDLEAATCLGERQSSISKSKKFRKCILD